MCSLHLHNKHHHASTMSPTTFNVTSQPITINVTSQPITMTLPRFHNHHLRTPIAISTITPSCHLSLKITHQANLHFSHCNTPPRQTTNFFPLLSSSLSSSPYLHQNRQNSHASPPFSLPQPRRLPLLPPRHTRHLHLPPKPYFPHLDGVTATDLPTPPMALSQPPKRPPFNLRHHVTSLPSGNAITSTPNNYSYTPNVFLPTLMSRQCNHQKHHPCKLTSSSHLQLSPKPLPNHP